MVKPFKPETRHHRDWAVTIYADPTGKGFYAKCASPKGLELSTETYNDKCAAWQRGYSLVEQVEKDEQMR